MDRELLLEIGTEEIPASWLPGLTVQIGQVLDARLKEARLAIEEPIETFSTPRRLTVRSGRIAERQTDLEELVTGPPVSAAFVRRWHAHAGGRRLREEAGRARRSDRTDQDAEGRIHRRAQASTRARRG